MADFAPKTAIAWCHRLQYGSNMAHFHPIDVPLIVQKEWFHLETPGQHSSLRPEFGVKEIYSFVIIRVDPGDPFRPPPIWAPS